MVVHDGRSWLERDNNQQRLHFKTVGWLILENEWLTAKDQPCTIHCGLPVTKCDVSLSR